MSSHNKEILHLWNNVACNHITTYEKAGVEVELIRLMQLMIPGKFYFYVVNFHDLQIDYISESVKDVLGIDPDSFSINTILNEQTAESLNHFKRKETLTADFLFNFLDPEQITDYRIQSVLEMKDSEGNIKKILHQVVTLKVSESGRVEHVMGVHTDISHLNIKHSQEVSFVHLNNGTSYYNLDTETGKFCPSLAVKDQCVSSVLSQRETAVLNKIAQGMSSEETAEHLDISANTVNTHRRSIIKKLNAKNIHEVITRGILDNTIAPMRY